MPHSLVSRVCASLAGHRSTEEASTGKKNTTSCPRPTTALVPIIAVPGSEIASSALVSGRRGRRLLALLLEAITPAFEIGVDLLARPPSLVARATKPRIVDVHLYAVQRWARACSFGPGDGYVATSTWSLAASAASVALTFSRRSLFKAKAEPPADGHNRVTVGTGEARVIFSEALKAARYRSRARGQGLARRVGGQALEDAIGLADEFRRSLPELLIILRIEILPRTDSQSLPGGGPCAGAHQAVERGPWR